MDSDYTKTKKTDEILEFNKIDSRIIKDFSKINNQEIDEVPLSFFVDIAFRHYSMYLNKQLKDINLTPKQIYILLILSNDHHINQESIASILNSNEVTTTREIYTLEKNNYVTREIDEDDKRKKIVLLTDKGKRFVNIITTFSKQIETNLNEYISPEELHFLRILLKKLLISVDKLILLPLEYKRED